MTIPCTFSSENAYSVGTIEFDLLKVTTTKIPLPTFELSDSSCSVAWSIISNAQNVLNDFSTIYTIEGTDLKVTNDINDFAQRKSLSGLRSYTVQASTSDGTETTSQKSFSIDFKDICVTSAITQ